MDICVIENIENMNKKTLLICLTALIVLIFSNSCKKEDKNDKPCQDGYVYCSNKNTCCPEDKPYLGGDGYCYNNNSSGGGCMSSGYCETCY